MDDLDFLDSSAIDYGIIPIDRLMKMVYGPDLYKSTDALYEISRRDYEKAVETAEDIFFNKKKDTYLQAQAISILLNSDSAKILIYLNKNLHELDSYILWTIVDFFYENPNELVKNNFFLLELIKLLDKYPVDLGDDKYEKREWLRKHLL